MLKHFYRNINCGIPAKRCRQAWHSVRPVARVSNDHDVGIEIFRMRSDKGDKTVGSHLLFALNKQLDIHAEPFAKDLQRPKMDSNSCAVIRGSPAIQAVALNRTGKGVSLPHTVIIRRRLHIMMSIKQDGRC